MRSSLAAVLLAVLSLSTPLCAATVQLDLTVDPAANSWQVFAEVQAGSRGLDGFSLDVVGTDGLVVVSSLNESPNGLDGTFPWGFFDFRSDGAAGVDVRAGQNSVYGPVNDPAKDALVLENVGIASGSRWSDDPVSPGTVAWDAKVLLASGSYSGVAGRISVAPRPGEPWSQLSEVAPGWVGPGNLEFPTAVFGDIETVPMPGDANVDGIVDEQDASILGAYWLRQTGAIWAMGDFNRDAKVDDRDAAILAAHWLATWPTETAPTPEPSTLALLAAGLAVLWMKRRKTREH
jgi:hypothetical protein